MNKHRILYFGTWGYGRAGLEGLLNTKQAEIVEVFTKWLPESPHPMMDQVKKIADDNNLPCFNTHKNHCSSIEFKTAILRHHQIDFVISCCFDRIFKPEILAFPKIMALNVHPSLLPKYRGIKPLENAIIQRESEVGVTIHELEKELDSGKILLQQGGISISSHQTLDELYELQCRLISEMVAEFFNSPDRYMNKAIPQDDDKVTFAPRPPFAVEGNMTVREIISLSGIQGQNL